MDRRTALALVAALVGSVGLGYAIFAPANDEELIQETLDRLAVALSFSEPIANPLFHGSHLSETFGEVFSENVHIRVAEIRADIPSHRGRLGVAAATVLQRYGSLDVAFSLTSLSVDGEIAEGEADATVTANGGGAGLRRDTRSVSFVFVKEDGDWKIQRAIVSAAE